jgi:N utilization substance protein B
MCSESEGCSSVDSHELEQEQENPEQLTRRDMRALVFHLLYALESYEYSISLAEIVENFNVGFDAGIAIDGEACHIAQAVIDDREQLDEMVKPFLHNWRFERLGQSTKLILRMALWELKQPDAIPNIVINEAVELAKCFAEKDAFKFVNGVLDEAVKARQPVVAE